VCRDRRARAVFADLTYQTLDSWTTARRVVAKAEAPPGLDGPKANPRFVVTSRPIAAQDARTLYEDVYCARGDMEIGSKNNSSDSLPIARAPARCGRISSA